MQFNQDDEPTIDEQRWGQALALLALAWVTSRCVGVPGVEADSWHVHCLPARWKPNGTPTREVIGAGAWMDPAQRTIEISAWTDIQPADELLPPLAHAYLEDTVIDPDDDEPGHVSHRLVVPVEPDDYPDWEHLAFALANASDAQWGALVAAARIGTPPEDLGRLFA